MADKVPAEYLPTRLGQLADDDQGRRFLPGLRRALRGRAHVEARSMPEALLLTGRERAVFRLLGFGYDNRSIARELQISERTVKRYVTGILAKLELKSRLQAGLAALIILSSSPCCDAYWPKSRMD